MASVTGDLHTGLRGASQRLPKFRLRIIIGKYHMNAVHLDHKGNLAVIPFFRRGSQLIQMFHTSFRRSIRKKSDSPRCVSCQCAALYLRQIFLSPAFHVKIESGIAVSILRFHDVIVKAHKILLHQFIRSKTIDIDPFKPRFIDGDQVIRGLSA